MFNVHLLDVLTVRLNVCIWVACVVPVSVGQMSYLVFLMLFAYMVLVKLEEQPSWPEWLVIAYILSTALEKTREVRAQLWRERRSSALLQRVWSPPRSLSLSFSFPPVSLTHSLTR